MAERQRIPDVEDEQQAPEHSPIEEEFASNEANTPAPRDGFMIFGYSLGIIVAAMFVLFLIAVLVVVLTR